ncbi:uncharacterized protein [Watersipora subatra]|uniref:uncharacterized protein isoform X2 n=1 Tax=Watersipora subatra TaxID=2589382 RepID=UPI00355AD097
MNLHDVHLLLPLFVTLIIPCQSYVASTLYSYACQGHGLISTTCNNGLILIESVTVITTANISELETASNGRECAKLEQCRRVIHGFSDEGLSDDYRHLYRWILNQCNGKQKCDTTKHTLPQWWNLVSSLTDCNANGIQYFAGVLLDINCLVNEDVPTVLPPPATTPRQKPSTPKTTLPFPVYVPIYQVVLQPREKILLGVAVGLSLAILLVLIVILYCWERYKRNRKVDRIFKEFGVPRAQTTDQIDGGVDPTSLGQNTYGEYSGLKPDEFVLATSDEYQVQTTSIASSMNNDTLTQLNYIEDIYRASTNRSRLPIPGYTNAICMDMTETTYMSLEDKHEEGRNELTTFTGNCEGY